MYPPTGAYVNEEAAQRQAVWVGRGRIKISAHLRGEDTAGLFQGMGEGVSVCRRQRPSRMRDDAAGAALMQMEDRRWKFEIT